MDRGRGRWHFWRSGADVFPLQAMKRICLLRRITAEKIHLFRRRVDQVLDVPEVSAYVPEVPAEPVQGLGGPGGSGEASHALDGPGRGRDGSTHPAMPCHLICGWILSIGSGFPPRILVVHIPIAGRIENPLADQELDDENGVAHFNDVCKSRARLFCYR